MTCGEQSAQVGMNRGAILLLFIYTHDLKSTVKDGMMFSYIGQQVWS